MAFSEPQILYSGAIGEGSRILYNRTPKERVEAVAPWLTIDGDAYPAVVDGRIQWIVDAYTTTNGYPYASRTTLGDTTADSLTDNNQRAVVAQQNQVNYIRNSVKATVDAYDGKVKLYEWDTKDPVLKTWMKAFPGTVKPKADIPQTLMDHLRYPQDLFKVQRELLTRYHVTDAAAVPTAAARRGRCRTTRPTRTGNAVPPYYLSMKMPGQKAQAFSLTTTFTPNGRRQPGAFMAVNADAGSQDYGKIRMLKLPTTNRRRARNRCRASSTPNTTSPSSSGLLQGRRLGHRVRQPADGAARRRTALRGAGLRARWRTQATRCCARCWSTYGGKTAFEDTLDEALNVVFGAEASDHRTPPEPPGEGTTKPPPTGNPTVQEALADAQKAFDDGQEALKKQRLARRTARPRRSSRTR